MIINQLWFIWSYCQYAIISSFPIVYCSANLQNSYEFNYFDYVSFASIRLGNISNQKILFSANVSRKFFTCGSFFRRTVEKLYYVSTNLNLDVYGTLKGIKITLMKLLLGYLQLKFSLDSSCTLFVKCRYNACRT